VLADDDQWVAVKLMKPKLFSSPGGMAFFRRQARVERTLDHTNIVPIVGSGVHDGQPYLVMKLMARGTLADREVRARYADPMARLDLVLTIAKAVQHAQER